MKHRTEQKKPSSPALGLWILAFALGFGTWYQTDHLVRLKSRMEGVESARREEAAFRRQVADMKDEIQGLRRELDSTSEEADRARGLEVQLAEMGQVIEAQADHLSRLEEVQATFGPDQVRRELDLRERRLREDWEVLNGHIEQLEQIASDSNRRVSELQSRDLTDMWNRLMGPVVQLAGDTSVGSGVLLESRRDAATGSYHTNLLTAWHVVRDIQGDLSRQHVPVPVTIYAMDGSVHDEKATLLAFDPEIDVALLEVVTPRPVRHGARMATPERLADIQIFDEIYAVGCPLGNDPIPTRGEIATNHHEVDGENYWMINAPTYIGNSGGGIFDGETFELLGIFSKIYTHGSLRPTIVPHMGLVTPLTQVYDWLEKAGYGAIIPKGEVGEASAARTPAGERSHG